MSLDQSLVQLPDFIVEEVLFLQPIVIRVPICSSRSSALRAPLFPTLQTLGATLESCHEEIVRMWRFTKTNSITEGLHNKTSRSPDVPSAFETSPTTA